VTAARAAGPGHAGEAEARDAGRAGAAATAESRGALPERRAAVVPGAGRALPAPVRTPMERRFRRDFSDVRVHDDAAADALARAESAAAFTVGTDVVFASGRFAPETARGRRLLAHELGHVAQQARPRAAGAGSAAADGLEAEAEAASRAAARGRPVGTLSPLPAGLASAIQRQAAGREPASEESTRKPPPAGVEEAGGRPLDAFLRLDTVTVLVLSAGWCENCHALLGDLADLVRERAGEQHRIRLRVVQVDTDEGHPNTVLLKALRRGDADVPNLPETHMFVERRREGEVVVGYTHGGDNMARFRDVLERTERTAFQSGSRIGRWIGLGLGIVGGAIGGAVLGGRSQDVGGFGGGILGGLLGGAIGYGAGWLLGGLAGKVFGSEIGAEPLSRDRIAAVRKFVDGVRGRSRAEFGPDGAELARDAVTLWVQDRQALPLSPKDRRVLIIEMLRGGGGRLKHRAILKVVEESSDAELLEIVNQVGPTSDAHRDDWLTIEDLRTGLGRSERAYLDERWAALRARFPIKPELGRPRAGRSSAPTSSPRWRRPTRGRAPPTRRASTWRLRACSSGRSTPRRRAATSRRSSRGPRRASSRPATRAAGSAGRTSPCWRRTTPT
jgi:hypothetical protein